MNSQRPGAVAGMVVIFVGAPADHAAGHSSPDSLPMRLHHTAPLLTPLVPRRDRRAAPPHCATPHPTRSSSGSSCRSTTLRHSSPDSFLVGIVVPLHHTAPLLTRLVPRRDRRAARVS